MRIGDVTLDDVRGRATISVDEAASVLGIARGSAYEAARLGELPILRFGRRMVVPTARLLAMLGEVDGGLAELPDGSRGQPR